MKYDARACSFNMDAGCVELTLQDGRKISIDCTGVEDALNVTMAQQTELDYLIKNIQSFTLKGNPVSQHFISALAVPSHFLIN